MNKAPTPIELATLHVAEFKQKFTDCIMLRRLIEQIMVGRVITVAAWHGRRCTVMKVKSLHSNIQLWGRVSGIRGVKLLCTNMEGAVLHGEKPPGPAGCSEFLPDFQDGTPNCRRCHLPEGEHP